MAQEGARVRVAFFDEASDHCILDVAQRDQQVPPPLPSPSPSMLPQCLRQCADLIQGFC